MATHSSILAWRIPWTAHSSWGHRGGTTETNKHTLSHTFSPTVSLSLSLSLSFSLSLSLLVKVMRRTLMRMPGANLTL